MFTKISRREFIALMGAGLAASTAACHAQSSGKTYAYVGSWTQGPFGVGGGGGISVFEVDVTDGSLTLIGHTGPEFEDMNAGFLAISDDGRFLYSTEEVKDLNEEAGAGGGIFSFAINPENGSLTYLNSQPSMGVNPAYIVIDPTGSLLLAANHANYDPTVTIVEKDGVAEVQKVYDDATVSMFPLLSNGTLAPASDVAILERIGGVAGVASQRGPHAHSVSFDLSNRFVIVCDKGANRLYTYRVDRENQTFEDAKSFPVAPGIAPRHSVFHPSAPYVFISNERGSSISSFHFDSSNGDVSHIQTVPMIPSDFTEPNAPSDIKLHPNGKFVYAANRGHNSIAIYRIDEMTGEMDAVDIVSSEGTTPRGVTFDPTGDYLMVANQGSNAVTTFSVNPDSGMLTSTGASAEVLKPACIKFVTV